MNPWIEETLRFDTSSQLLARYLLRDVELHGVIAPQGSKLLLCLGSANRDERVFSRPDDYDIFRGQAELDQILSFGGGRHFCLGANLARLETRIALSALVEPGPVGRGRPRPQRPRPLRQRARLRLAAGDGWRAD